MKQHGPRLTANLNSCDGSFHAQRSKCPARPGGILQSIYKNAQAYTVFVCSVNTVRLSGIFIGIHTDSRRSNENAVLQEFMYNLCK